MGPAASNLPKLLSMEEGMDVPRFPLSFRGVSEGALYYVS